MFTPNIYYSALLLFIGAACLAVMFAVWHGRRVATGSVALVVLLLALSWWDITYAVFWSGIPGPTLSFWMDATYVGVVVVPAACLTFALAFAQMDHWLNRPFLVALCVEPILVLVLMWTDPWHGLFFAGKRDLNITMMISAGPVFWMNVVYSYLLVLVGALLLLRKYVRSQGLYRQQTAAVLGASVIPWVNNILFFSGLNPLPNIDNTPFAFSVAALLYSYALLRYRLLDLVPIARDVLVEKMSDGVIVLDARNRIVDINPAAQRAIRFLPESPIGEPAEKIFSAFPDIVAVFQDLNQASTEIAIGDSPRQYFDFRISPLVDRRHGLVGRLMVFRDMTALKNAQAELERFATTDALTQVCNRRHFLELADKELKRALRLKHPMALIMMDLDHFKHVNDAFGHAAGDEVLCAFADGCRKNIREIDLLARFGGEEFVLLIPETGGEQAYQIAERLCLAVADSPIDYGECQIRLSASLGVATLAGEQDTLDSMLRRADEALYAAKLSGRNRVVVWRASSTP